MLNSLNPSLISAKKLITYFSLVCFALSIPIVYLIYADSHSYRVLYQSTELEISGDRIVGDLLSDFALLGVNNRIKNFEREKQKNKEELITKNILKLSESELKEAETIFNVENQNSKQSLSQYYYGPLIRFVGIHSNLILDPSTDAYFLMDVLIFRLPRIYSIIAEGGVGDEVFTESSLREIRDVLGEIDYSLKTAKTYSKSNSTFSHTANLRAVTDAVDSHTAGKNKLSLTDFVQKTQILQSDIVQDLDGILINRNKESKKDKIIILSAVAVLWLIGIIFGFILFINVIKEHGEIFKHYLRLSKQLEESEKLSFIGEIATSIAHEVKNPLTIIDFEALMLKKNLDSADFDKDKAVNRLSNIAGMSARINKISNMITSFARKTNVVPFESIPFKKILDDSLYLTQLKASKFDIPIEVTPLDCDLSCRMIELEQVFINLINNAIDAVEPLSEKWIKIVPSLVEKNGAEWLVVRFIDSGTGINKDVVENMFTSFYTTKALGKGTGLGFSIVLRIVNDHQGKIYYDQESKNTTFVLEIPRVQ